jgi:hypothetical protein
MKSQGKKQHDTPHNTEVQISYRPMKPGPERSIVAVPTVLCSQYTCTILLAIAQTAVHGVGEGGVCSLLRKVVLLRVYID